MRILDFFKKYQPALLTLLISGFCYAQEGKTTIKQDPRFEQLLAEKRKVNSSLNVSDRFKIQIFTGENEPAKKTLTEFRKAFKNTDATIVFNTPIYKVWVGNFKTRIEAEKKLSELKKKYPNAFIVKPNK
ncbi:SPOR domain-containing protein [Flavobacterium amniphilum]|uniref:SPOR domain-containing protein n=1 Tax=Flavobacterium amniphilum TaxID=1834035 RepID=UPI00202A8102|nr:SPOR domain-containing protein [Flavobacterium amniphilum]MCL9806438.1 SPOR domain-containing protein [Flavobacterium amniphilum]